jgi:hypothetical protein
MSSFSPHSPPRRIWRSRGADRATPPYSPAPDSVADSKPHDNGWPHGHRRADLSYHVLVPHRSIRRQGRAGDEGEPCPTPQPVAPEWSSAPAVVPPPRPLHPRAIFQPAARAHEGRGRAPAMMAPLSLVVVGAARTGVRRTGVEPLVRGKAGHIGAIFPYFGLPSSARVAQRMHDTVARAGDMVQAGACSMARAGAPSATCGGPASSTQCRASSDLLEFLREARLH